MISVMVQAQTDSLATWLGVIGQWVGAVGTLAAVGIALWIALSDRRRDAKERRDQEAAQARLITVAVGYSDYYQPYDHEYAMARVVITNSEQRVLRPEVTLMRGAEPPVRWGPEVSAEGGEPFYLPPMVLMPGDRHMVPFEHVAADGRIVDPAEASDVYTAVREVDTAGKVHVISQMTAAGKIKKWTDVDDVTITFTDMSGLRWRRTGSSEPVRVLQPAPGTE